MCIAENFSVPFAGAPFINLRMTEPPPLQQIDRTYVMFRGQKFSYFGGCDYFRLSSHPKVLRAAERSLRRFGLNVSASRTTTGNHALYQELESALTGFFDAEDALLVGNGYATNLIAGQALAGNFSHALIDQRSHPSLVDAARFLNCPVITFEHRDAADVARQVQRIGAGARLILLTDGMFSHDGSVAPLKKYLQSLPRDAMLLVDDAHGAGVLGETGQGSLQLEGVHRRRIIQTLTLSKAFGSYGGAILGTPKLREQIFAKSGQFVGHTPVPLPLAGAAMAAIRILAGNPRLRARLKNNVDRIKTILRKNFFPIPETPGPIVSVMLPTPGKMEQLRRRLLATQIFPPFIQYPGGPAEGYFRFVISSEHRRDQLDSLLRALLAQGIQ